jgi:hypothetical protein
VFALLRIFQILSGLLHFGAREVLEELDSYVSRSCDMEGLTLYDQHGPAMLAVDDGLGCLLDLVMVNGDDDTIQWVRTLKRWE